MMKKNGEKEAVRGWKEGVIQRHYLSEMQNKISAFVKLSP